MTHTKIRAFHESIIVYRNSIPVLEYFTKTGDMDVLSDLTLEDSKELLQTLLELYSEQFFGDSISLPKNPAHIPHWRN